MDHAVIDRSSARSSYELLFRSLFVAGRGYSFPCDAQGRVEVESLSPRARTSYLQAQAGVGRELATPAIVRSACEPDDL